MAQLGGCWPYGCLVCATVVFAAAAWSSTPVRVGAARAWCPPPCLHSVSARRGFVWPQPWRQPLSTAAAASAAATAAGLTPQTADHLDSSVWRRVHLSRTLLRFEKLKAGDRWTESFVTHPNARILGVDMGSVFAGFAAWQWGRSEQLENLRHDGNKRQLVQQTMHLIGQFQPHLVVVGLPVNPCLSKCVPVRLEQEHEEEEEEESLGGARPAQKSSSVPAWLLSPPALTCRDFAITVANRLVAPSAVSPSPSPCHSSAGAAAVPPTPPERSLVASFHPRVQLFDETHTSLAAELADTRRYNRRVRSRLTAAEPRLDAAAASVLLSRYAHERGVGAELVEPAAVGAQELFTSYSLRDVLQVRRRVTMERGISKCH
eukprot:GHVU01188471.1.p1 GENE.GHVU01188471.1~~GHVU01188471.1.p1  ORF type:complete len:375 (-),score=40.48 GHVU01188471.1:1137-2261(-)